MSAEFEFDDKGKVKRKTKEETNDPQKADEPLTRDQMQGDLDASKITRMQQTLGNDAVQRYLAQRSGEGGAEIDEETTASIQDERGRGHKLNEDVAQEAGEAMGQDFSDVTVHTDSQADELNRRLGARAFTTGKDIFFREGAYEPGSRDGQKLIAHELTHVAQQGGEQSAVQGELRLNDPDDRYEAEADDVADAVVNQGAEAAVQRQAEEEEEELVQAQAEEEEEEMLQMQEMEEEEEELQA
jgi:hypothetical protein